MNKALPFVLALGLLGILVWLVFFWNPSADRHLQHQRLGVSDAPRGGDFTLESPGGPVALRDLRGQVVVLYFGYTWCPDICPTSLAALSLALKELSAVELAQVQGLFVSVDPERDDLSRLQEYTAYFHPRILGITGTPEAVAEAAGLYGAAYRKVKQASAADYVVDHSASTYVIDRGGRLAHILQHGTPPPEILAAIRDLLEKP